nr:hypothetical protein [uncultured Chryseobacterium sp.]
MAVADNYTEKSNFMLARQFAEKSLKLVESIPEKEYLRSRKILRRKTYLYYYCAVLFLQAKNPDKALFFIKKSYEQVFKEKSRNSGLPLECFGDYYMQKKNYREAVIYYKKSIEIKQQFYQRTYPADTKIAEAYFKIGMADSANFYLSRAEKYRNLDLKSNNLDSANAERYLDEEAKEIVRKDNINYAIIVLSTIIVLLAMILYLYNYLTRLKTNKSMRISENEIIIKEKQNEIDDLNVKLNESFEELVKLAKENSPYFWIRFQEVHPHYRSKILSLNPNLRTSELTLSAYIYLGFTSKEIATYTFKAVKTIENNRSNFRKKINLSPDKDLSVFIREYVM